MMINEQASRRQKKMTNEEKLQRTYNEIYDLKPFGVNAVDSDNSPKSELKKESK